MYKNCQKKPGSFTKKALLFDGKWHNIFAMTTLVRHWRTRTVQKAGTCNDPAEAMRGGVVCHSGCHKKKMRRLEES